MFREYFCWKNEVKADEIFAKDAFFQRVKFTLTSSP